MEERGARELGYRQLPELEMAPPPVELRVQLSLQTVEQDEQCVLPLSQVAVA
jgi:hypothetical protein